MAPNASKAAKKYIVDEAEMEAAAEAYNDCNGRCNMIDVEDLPLVEEETIDVEELPIVNQ